MKFVKENLKWVNEPVAYEINEEYIKIKADKNTDFWQRTHYGFRNDNGHALLMEGEGDFTFSLKTKFKSQKRYDQCGVIIYENSDNWFKASIEYEDGIKSRLGSVVTNGGYSDWATTDISNNIDTMWYRLSKRGKDFLIENSVDGKVYKQMRIFHLDKISAKVNFGIYACSPQDSSIEAVFTEFELKKCLWKVEE